MTLALDDDVFGCQEPTFSHLPASYPNLNTVGSEVVDLAKLAGLFLDPWQAWFIEQSMAKTQKWCWNPYTNRNEHQWAAREVGLMVSRQCGKGSILEARELAGLFLLGERLIIHSAHLFETSAEAFERIMTLIESTPDLDREVARVSRSHGSEGITIKPPRNLNVTGRGQTLRFRTRTAGGGRGLSADCVILDEALYLTAKQMSALMPTLSARPNPQIWYTSSAGDENSAAMAKVYRRARKAEELRLFWAEWAAQLCDIELCPPDCTEHDDPADPQTWLKTVPGIGYRITLETVAEEYKAMTTEGFAMERLSVPRFPAQENSWLMIPQTSWEARHVETSRPDGDIVIAAAVAPDLKRSSIVAAALNSEGHTHVEVTGRDFYDAKPGWRWLAPRLIEIWNQQRPAFIVIDKSSQTGQIIEALEAAGVRVVSPQSREYAQACADFRTGIAPTGGEKPTIVHLAQDPLTKSVAAADKRTLSGMWAWASNGADITSLEAATLAVYGLKQYLNSPAPVLPWVMRR